MAKKSKYENALLKIIMKKSKYLLENFGEEEDLAILFNAVTRSFP